MYVRRSNFSKFLYSASVCIGRPKSSSLSWFQCGSISRNGATSEMCLNFMAAPVVPFFFRSHCVMICATMFCIHVVPDLGYEHMNTSLSNVCIFQHACSVRCEVIGSQGP